MLIGATPKNLALVVNDAERSAPQGELADGVGEARLADREAISHQRVGRLAIGGDEHLERRTGLHLRVELADGSEGEDGLVAGLRLELGGDLLHRRNEVGRDGDLDLGRTSALRHTEEHGPHQHAG